MRASLWILAAAAAMPAAAHAQTGQIVPPGLTIQGNGNVETPPDTATLALSLRGEGKTSDEASRDLAKRQKDVVGGIASLDSKLELQTGSVAISEQRKGDCMASSDMEAVIAGADDSATDKGPCRVVGYVATIDATVTMHAIDKAGTAVGLAGRLGATSARVGGFGLADDAAARRQAFAAAFADARTRAEAMAKAAGLRLGPITSVLDTPDMRFAGMLDVAAVSTMIAPMDIAEPPVEIDVSPTPVTTHATVVVIYSLLP